MNPEQIEIFCRRIKEDVQCVEGAMRLMANSLETIKKRARDLETTARTNKQETTC